MSVAPDERDVFDGGDEPASGGGEEPMLDGGDEPVPDGDGEPGVSVEVGDISVADAVADLWVRLAADQRSYGSHLLAETNRQLARDSAAQHAVTGGLLVARVDDELVGFMTFSTEQGDYDVDTDRGLIHDLFVATRYRSRGIGARLLEAAEERLAADGVDRVSLEAMAANTDARRFYERHGYEPFRVELEKTLDE
ncbi:GNAT family N-acetyltransferase [Halobaculum sp. MBLA0147]|uniref:GNAT family N-acetyltransferase n=1 Tax=Halobaculum sp. MBLA0147 TaxID=3079934 RepID=UPI00352663CB